MKMFIVLLCTFPMMALAKSQGLTNYVKMQEALANDDMKVALSEHKTLCKKDAVELKAEYKDCGKEFKEIEGLRESFKRLSDFYIKHADKKEMDQLIVAECPMAKAKWIQTKGGIRNPYYGKSMLECGQKI
ncbi:MAG: hypothetical protein K2P81_14665 [Bacteriovoracaceae bacterium]|nr:hypothetical protein [Bacteriovoracaceae bacterium]